MKIGDLALTPVESEILERSLEIYRTKHGGQGDLKDVMIAGLKAYLELYDQKGDEKDWLSETVVYGPRYYKSPVRDLDDVARLLVKGEKCDRCGQCCRRTIGVKVTAGEIETIEAFGFKEEEFLDRDGMIRSGPEGCYFLVNGRNGTSLCRIYEKRPQICQEFFCNGRKRGLTG